ncbi:MAG: paraslipin, partial [Spirochaetia bacterium]|nr:paraslipin [Spirochaetia bacterium]
AINISEGEKQRRINEAEGTAREIELVAIATSEALTSVANAISDQGGAQAVQLRITEEYIKQFGDVVRTAQTSVVPLGPATVQAAFQGFSKIMDGLSQSGGGSGADVEAKG